MRSAAGLRPHALRELQRYPDPLAASEGRDRVGEGKGRRGERNREGIASLLFNFWLWAWEQHTDGRTPDRYTDVYCVLRGQHQ